MDDRDARLFAATALLSGNPTLLEQAEALGPERLGVDLHHAVLANGIGRSQGGGFLLRAANLLPAPLQYVAQRMVLVSPRLARAILRRTGLHHQLY